MSTQDSCTIDRRSESYSIEEERRLKTWSFQEMIQLCDGLIRSRTKLLVSDKSNDTTKAQVFNWFFAPLIDPNERNPWPFSFQFCLMMCGIVDHVDSQEELKLELKLLGIYDHIKALSKLKTNQEIDTFAEVDFEQTELWDGGGDKLMRAPNRQKSEKAPSLSSAESCGIQGSLNI